MLSDKLFREGTQFDRMKVASRAASPFDHGGIILNYSPDGQNGIARLNEEFSRFKRITKICGIVTVDLYAHGRFSVPSRVPFVFPPLRDCHRDENARTWRQDDTLIGWG